MRARRDGIDIAEPSKAAMAEKKAEAKAAAKPVGDVVVGVSEIK